MERILIVRLGAMGDVLHGLPVAAALRCAFPDALIGWAVEERWSELLVVQGEPLEGTCSENRPMLDAVHPVNTRAWRAMPFSRLAFGDVVKAVLKISSKRYEVALDLQGLLKSALVSRASGASRRLGFALPRERAAAWFYTHRVSASGTHVVEQNLSLLTALSLPAAAPELVQLPRDASCETWCEAELQRHGVQSFALLSPGGGWGAKLWPAARYAEVARALAADGLRSLVNIAPGEEDLALEVEKNAGGAAMPLRCTVGQLIALTRRARLFVGCDSGPLHLAAALGIPVVALFGPTDPARNGPWGTRSVVLRRPASQTSYSHVATPDPGLLSISSAEVAAAARSLLEERHG